MLVAVGIASEVEFVGGEVGYVVLVEAAVRHQALHHLWMYEQERRDRPPPEEPALLEPRAWVGSLVYVCVLLLVPLALGQGWFPVEPYDAGVMDPRRMQAGQWWRALTALTLHWDAAHLVGNLGSGALLGFTAAQVWGNARAWLLIILAAGVANATEGALGIAHYVSAGASTAVFAMLGLVAAHAWRTRGQRAASSLKRWAPLIAGVTMLGFFGAGGQDPEGGIADPTNVLSHVLGFASGVALGAAVATRRGAAWLGAIPAWLATAASLAAIALSWTQALRSSV
ncbi:MAG: rhomboid family intramembrane serine protease [Steroidobacteraceae bacterium]